MLKEESKKKLNYNMTEEVPRNGGNPMMAMAIANARTIKPKSQNNSFKLMKKSGRGR